MSSRDVKISLPKRGSARCADCLLPKVFPDRSSSATIQWVELESQVDPACNCLVNGLDTIHGEEEYSFVVLQHTEEHADKGIAMNACCLPLLNKHVRFVQEKNRLPVACEFEYGRKSGFDLYCRCAKFFITTSAVKHLKPKLISVIRLCCAIAVSLLKNNRTFSWMSDSTREIAAREK